MGRLWLMSADEMVLRIDGGGAGGLRPAVGVQGKGIHDRASGYSRRRGTDKCARDENTEAAACGSRGKAKGSGEAGRRGKRGGFPGGRVVVSAGRKGAVHGNGGGDVQERPKGVREKKHAAPVLPFNACS